MKVLIALMLMIIAGCSSTPKKHVMRNCLAVNAMVEEDQEYFLCEEQ
jgi:starvation-inducible outer membrane lipoprotein